jgi:hypothetical protein
MEYEHNLGIEIVDNILCNDFDNSCKKINCYVSFTMYSIVSIDAINRSAKMKIVVDHKYKVKDYLKVFSYTPNLESIKIPWIVVNMVDSEIKCSNSMLKRTTLENPNIKNTVGASVYGGYNSIDTSLTYHKVDDSIVKCESCTMIIDVSYYTEERHAPFDTIHLFFKLATTGQPGTEYIDFIFDKEDSNFQGYNVIGGGYYPILDEPIINNVFILYDQLKIRYSRLYLILSYKHNWISDVVKYYIIPNTLMLLLVIVEIHSNTELISIASTLILADIALLFTIPTRSYISFMEYSLIIHILFKLLSTYILLEFNTKIIRIFLGCLSILTGCITFTYQYSKAFLKNKKILKGIHNNDYNELKTK